MAQAVDCPSIVKSALDIVDASCSDTGRNEVCYGNITLNATLREGVGNLTFTKAGDRAHVADIQTLQLSSMSLTDKSWGVALMEVQANLPDTQPGQNVVFLLFGDVSIDNAMTSASEIPVITTGNVNVRLRPTTNSNNVISSLKSGEKLIATGRLLDSSWVRIKVENDARGIGWVSADFLQGDLNKLSIIRPDAPTWGPMQSFYFKTGAGDRPCAQAPDSGILIQTPKGVGKVTLNANDVEITLGSTVYLQAQPNNLMTVTVVEGQATLQVAGQTQIVPAGTYSQVQLDAKGHASGSASYPKAYDEQPLQTLPLRVSLFTPVTIALPLTTAQINAKLEAATASVSTQITSVDGSSNTTTSQGGLPRSGVWVDSMTTTKNTCDPSTLPVGGVRTSTPNLVFSADGSTLTFVFGGGVSQNYSRVADNVYVAINSYGQNGIQTITFTSPTTFTDTWRSEANCTFWHDGTGHYNG